MNSARIKIALIILVAIIVPGGMPMLAAYTAARKAKEMHENQDVIEGEAG